MSDFRKLTPTNGFDTEDLNNARQNNYAWSMSDLGEYIYVGTGRNILVNVIKSIEPQTQLPDLIKPDPIIPEAEIWRYRKDRALPWERVYKAPAGSGIFGFRFMIRFSPFNGSPALFAAAYGTQVSVLKSTNGVNWFILPNDTLKGTSSRAMVVQNEKLYLSTVDEIGSNPAPLLYSSRDPEFYPWVLETDYSKPGYDPKKNPVGAISNMAVFNDRIYVATSNDDGVQVWRTNGPEPRLNDWTLVVGDGFGDPANKYSLAIGVFQDHLYVSGTKQLPLSWFIPMGCDVVRISKNDEWQVVVGGNPFISSDPSEDRVWNRYSRMGSGFNNPFNVYAWQIQEYKGNLYISTFDDSSNMEVILDTLLANREALEQLIGDLTTRALIDIYTSVIEILHAVRYPIGFDLYMSEDGVHFMPLFLNGLNNPDNYGGRILFVDSQDKMYIGTANPFEGCEVWVVGDEGHCVRWAYDENAYRELWSARKIINEHYDIIRNNMPAILKFLPPKHYHKFT